ncbi:MAG TPA: M90 family metallopeptidase [Gemmatimonadales bacterium]|nr:M90 family metallopeptidase [Gemmatimonadales bacterium]
MIRLLVTLAASGMFAGAFAIARVMLRRYLGAGPDRPRPHSPVPARWRSELEASVPLARRLPPEQRERLLEKMHHLIAGCRWEGCGGLVLTEEMQLVIAAHACLLVLEHPGEPYPALRNVLVYPGTFRPRRFSWTPSADAAEVPGPALGESWKHGVVILAWDSAESGASDAGDGRNVVLHEFAHQLDGTDGRLDGTPRLPDAASLAAWASMLEEQFRSLQEEAGSGTQRVLDHYGATDEAEFFAVATEAFFERPAELLRERPALYESLREYYRQDPLRS